MKVGVGVLAIDEDVEGMVEVQVLRLSRVVFYVIAFPCEEPVLIGLPPIGLPGQYLNAGTWRILAAQISARGWAEHQQPQEGKAPEPCTRIVKKKAPSRVAAISQWGRDHLVVAETGGGC